MSIDGVWPGFLESMDHETLVDRRRLCSAGKDNDTRGCGSCRFGKRYKYVPGGVRDGSYTISNGWVRSSEKNQQRIGSWILLMHMS